MKCVDDCEFMKYKAGSFMCEYYECKLDSKKALVNDKSNLSNTSALVVYRCEDCINDGVIGMDDVQEKVRKLKKYIGWLADSFYSHKDAFEEGLTDIYRMLKSMEDGNEKK